MFHQKKSKIHRDDMATIMEISLEDKNLPVSPVVRELAEAEKLRRATAVFANMGQQNLEVNIITEISAGAEVLSVADEMVWVQIPCAVDSGACANVAPGNVFCITDACLPTLEPKYFGADGTPIVNLGSLVAEGVSEEGLEMKIDFDLGKVTRPLLSVFKMTAAGHRVQFDEKGGSIQIKGSNRRIQLRQEGRLYMLDLWCKVSSKLAASSPFIRQVAKA